MPQAHLTHLFALGPVNNNKGETMKRKVPKKKYDTPILSGYADSLARRAQPGGCDTCGGAFLVLPGSKPGLVRLRIFHAATCPEGLADADRVASAN